MSHPPIDQQITFLYTRDLPTTAHFYEEIMGLPLVLDQGSCRIYQVTEDGYIGFCQRAEAPEKPQGVILTIVTEKVDLWHQVLSNQGVAFESLPRLNPEYKIYHCFLRDPNGYLIEIQKFLDPAWGA
ncbi:MAG: VOC family protein [Anaerolineales bacterium]|nr:VOC family protein [Anaerolineales bacterium]